MTALKPDVGNRSRAEAQLRAVLDAVPTALLLVDPEGAIRYANDRAAAVFGHARGDLDGCAVTQLLPGSTCVVSPRHAVRPGQPPLQAVAIDPPARRRSGEEFPAEVLINVLQLDGRTHRVVAVIDLTEKRDAEQELAFERESMAHMSRVMLVGEISGSLAHELNQPLAAILSNAQAALRILRRDPGDVDEIREILDDIVENDRRAGDVIQRLRGMLRRECRTFGPLVVDELVQDSIRIIRNDLINRGVEYRLDLTVPIGHVRGDRVQLQQVLLNLIINACDAMAAGPQRVLSVRTEAQADGWIRIEVRDSGPGIAPDRFGAIFEPFQTTKPHGLGMGLPICRTLLRAHGGRIHADNLPGGGAVFCVYLPILE
ncbi:ATP-binding protein [Paracidovorax citrulli]